MKYFRVLILLLAFPLLLGTSSHKFYVSITKIEYVAEKQSVQIITKIFTDDIEDALQQRYNPSITLGEEKQTEADIDFLKKYILQKLKLKVNGEPVKLNYLGQEYDTDMVVSYIEVTGVKSLNTIEIENTILMDMFSEQQNIIHLKTADSRRSLILEANETKGMLNFND